MLHFGMHGAKGEKHGSRRGYTALQRDDLRYGERISGD
jgi:hypothetical protein